MNVEELISSFDFSNLTWQIITPIIFSAADILTGFIQALINDNVNSKTMRVGLLHKVLIVAIILLGFVCEHAFNLAIIPKFICGYVVVMETISIAENLSKAGLDVKDLLKVFKLTKINEEEKDKENNE